MKGLKYSHFRIAKTSLGHVIHIRMSSQIPRLHGTKFLDPDRNLERDLDNFAPCKRDGQCEAWTKQTNNTCVTMRNQMFLVTVGLYRMISGQ